MGRTTKQTLQSVWGGISDGFKSIDIFGTSVGF